MTISAWLKMAQLRLRGQHVSSARIDAELILCNIQKCQRSWLLIHPTSPLPNGARAKADALLRRRLNHEPMAYILGQKDFYGLEIDCDARALIPRGESEVLVEEAMAKIDSLSANSRHHRLVIAEVGTGSGAIICALGATAPGHTFIATDVSLKALELAGQNARKHNLDIVFLNGSLCEPLQNYEAQIDILVANLPYVPEKLLTVLDPTVRYFEPHLALSGGSDGLKLYRRFIPQTKSLLSPNGCLIVEHEFNQGEAMRQLMADSFPGAQSITKPDFSGHDRMTVLQT